MSTPKPLLTSVVIWHGMDAICRPAGIMQGILIVVSIIRIMVNILEMIEE